MIRRTVYEQVLFDTIIRGATVLPSDVEAAFRHAILKERSPAAKSGLEHTLQSMELSKARANPLCPDTGWPIFYFKVGNSCVLEGGLLGLEDAARRSVARATACGYLRATMKHPLTGWDPGNNIGENIPDFTYRFVPGSDITLTYVAKGGGSECFGGTRHRMIAFADGLAGIKKFVVDSFTAASRAGAVCPPSILGIGIGGTANVAANLAKQAAALRTVGSRHPEADFALLETELYGALNSLGVGVMGAGGDTSVFAVHIEYAYTHLAGIACDLSCNCMVARRATTRIQSDETVRELEAPDWFEDRIPAGTAAV